jgi:toxin ParE1/3/4
MALKITLRPIAILEVEEAVNWYENQSTKLGERFLYIFNDAVKHVSKSPYRYKKRHKNIRAFVLKEFPYSIFYIVEELEMVVIAVVHQKRNPKIWKKRG